MGKEKEHEFFMREALKEAQKALQKNEVPIGAVIACNGRIISRAHNLTETLGDPTAHAEMQAITAATNYIGGKYLNQCTLYVTIEPCAMCAGAIHWAQLGGLVFGAPDPKRGFTQFSSKILHPKTFTIANVLSEECSSIVTSFFSRKR
ncbi:MAG: tRNA(adenine34) deaminase [Tenuifilum sp.]|jgi:tRNA(adenine34) deaminase|uniref:nucleoside deaminase n=1 Tax=Tenuifilum sp. TaxID=2760880 RepID=UPI0024AB7D6A|nr:nucleoside deaminase [Tenuifilum sp.]MDI3525969.1 tRNA(adenine34) deaminase [Tenuifilum sp.]